MSDPVSFNAGDLTKIFDDKRRAPTGETLDQIRQNYFIAAQMSDSDDNSVGGLNINKSGRRDNASIDQKKRNQATDDFILMIMLDDRLTVIENNMIEKYGEDFAETMAAEFLDEDTHTRLMQIKDPEERRKAIAKEINDGIENGTIDPDEVYQNPDFKEWLDTHAAYDEAKIENAKSGPISENKLTEDYTEEAALDGLLPANNGGFNLS